MYLDFPTLPSCKTVCLPFSCPIKVVYLVSAAILIFHFGVTVMCSSDSQLGMKHTPPGSSGSSSPRSEPCTPSFLPSPWSPVHSALSSVMNTKHQLCSQLSQRIWFPAISQESASNKLLEKRLHGCRKGLLSIAGQLCSSSPASPLGAH